MAAENIVAMPGFDIPSPCREPVADVVSQLEKLLEMARSGVLIGIAYAAALNKGSSGQVGTDYETGWTHGAGARTCLATGVMTLTHRFGIALAGEDS